LMMWPAIFADNANGKRMALASLRDLLGFRQGGHRLIGLLFRRLGLQQSRQKETRRRNAVRGVDATATGADDGKGEDKRSSQKSPVW
jgi:hypothetical protein